MIYSSVRNAESARIHIITHGKADTSCNRRIAIARLEEHRRWCSISS